MALSPTAAETPRPEVVLTRALLRASRLLGMQQKELARVIGVSPATVSRLDRCRTVDPETKQGELALLLLRVYRGLDALVGGDDSKARAWFRADNAHIGGTPAELVQTVTGLANVAGYLDAMRGAL